MALTRRPSWLASTGYYKDHTDIRCFAEGGTSAASMRSAAGPRCVGSGRCTFPAGPRT